MSNTSSPLATTTSLVPSTQGSSSSSGGDLASATAIAQHFQKSGYWTDARDISKAVTKIMIGRSLGLDPFSSMSNIIIVQGKLTMSAHLMGRLIKASGKYRWILKESSADECSIVLYEKVDTGPGTWEWCEHAPFTRKRDEYKHLFKNPTWQQYPRNMLFARTMTDMAKFLCPEVLGGSVYLPDELPGTEGNLNPETLMPINNDLSYPGSNDDIIEAVLEVDSSVTFNQELQKAAKEGDALADQMIRLERDQSWLTQILNKRVKSWNSLTKQQATTVSQALEVYDQIHGS